MKGVILLVAAASALTGWAASTASARTLHYPVTVTVTGPGRVTGTGDGGTIDCPGACTVLIRQGTSLTLAARPSENATFGGWGGDCVGNGTGAECTVTAAHHRDKKNIPRGGTTAELSFRVYGDGGRTREELTVASGNVTIARVVVPMAHTRYGVTYSGMWRVPKGSTPGTRLYCAVAIDEAGNKSKRSCSPLR